MAISVYLTNDQTTRININAERIDQQITKAPMVYDRLGKTEPKTRELGKMRNIFLIHGFINNSYDVDNNGSPETAIVQKHYIEDQVKAWGLVGRGTQFQGRCYLTWTDRTYTGIITKANLNEVAGLVNQYELVIEFMEGSFL